MTTHESAPSVPAWLVDWAAFAAGLAGTLAAGLWVLPWLIHRPFPVKRPRAAAA